MNSGLRSQTVDENTNEQVAGVARTYRLGPDLVAASDGLAAAYGAPQSQIVGILLQIGLEELEAGRRSLTRRPVRYTLDLDSARSDI